MLAKERSGAVMIRPDTFFDQESRLITSETIKHRLPSIGLNRLYAEAGGAPELWARLEGQFSSRSHTRRQDPERREARRAPFEQPTRYYFVINLKACKTLGLSIPPTLQVQADDVIQ